MIWGAGENIGRDFFFLAEALKIFFFCGSPFPGEWPSVFFLDFLPPPQIINVHPLIFGHRCENTALES